MHSIQHLIHLALAEDIGPGDITTDNLIPEKQEGRGVIISKQPLVLAGLDVAKQVFSILDSGMDFSSNHEDGDRIEDRETILEIKGSLKALLKGERTALNFLQHLSGIATHVRSYVDQLGDLPVRLVATRKTTPGWRTLEKYAVQKGGAYNHRMGLYDGVLIKDNHIAACGGIAEAVKRLRNRISHLVRIEIEASDLSQVKEALDAGAEAIMLDNMDLDQIKEAVKLISGRALVEVSGMITRKNLKAYAGTGVDIISSGALTHSAPSVDISMRIST